MCTVWENADESDSITHELSRMIFHFKRDGYLETMGPAGTNAMNQL